MASIIPTYSVIVPVWNHADLTATLLRGLMACRDYEVLVIDNGSTDETPALLERMGKTLPLTVLRADANLGFPKACNWGLKEAAGTYLILLNNDVLIEDPKWMDRLSAPIRAVTRTLTGPTLMNKSPWAILPDGRYVPYLEGWCIGMPRRALTDIGLLDEAFSPGSFEDVDYSERAMEAGYRLVQTYCGLVHLYNRTWGDLPGSAAVSFRNRDLWLRKHADRG